VIGAGANRPAPCRSHLLGELRHQGLGSHPSPIEDDSRRPLHAGVGAIVIDHIESDLDFGAVQVKVRGRHLLAQLQGAAFEALDAHTGGVHLDGRANGWATGHEGPSLSRQADERGGAGEEVR